MSYPYHMESDDSFDYLFKIVLIGDAGVGKTCVVQRFKSGTFLEKQHSTIGVDFTMKSLIVDGKKVKVGLFDAMIMIFIINLIIYCFIKMYSR